MSHSLAPDADVRAFRALGWTVTQAEAAAAAGMDRFLVGTWVRRGRLSFEQATAWWDLAGQTGDDAGMPRGWGLPVLDWAHLGVRHPDDRPPGVSLATVLMCQIAGVAPDPGWGERGAPGRGPASDRLFLCPTLMAVTSRCRQDPAVAAALLTTLGARNRGPLLPRQECEHRLPAGYPASTAPLRCEWDRRAVKNTQRYLLSLRGLDWADVAACLRAGMTPAQARVHVRSGAEMEPVRLLAALAA